MGNICRKTSKIQDSVDKPPTTETIVGHGSITTSPVQQWENRQKDLNFIVLEKMREDFHNRPDIFLLNLLVASLQFYQNFYKEKADISNHIRDREQALSKKLTSSKRKILYLGGFEEISGTHVLFKGKDEKYMELPTPLQINVVQDNVEVYSYEQYDELQQRSYSDVDGPSYRFCAEFSKKHNGYVRLRCADIIPGISRHNTYEDIYAFLAPVDDSQPDPVVDPRPLRRNSLISSSKDEDHVPHQPGISHRSLYSVSSFEEEEDDAEEDDDTFEEEMQPPPKSILKRRPSGVMPINYPTGSLLNKHPKSSLQQNGFPGAKIRPKKEQPNLERRPSGIFPKLNPNMDKLIFTKKQRQKIDNDDEFAELKRILADIEEDEEEDESDGGHEITTNAASHSSKLYHKAPEVPKETEPQAKPPTPEGQLRLHASINKGCFVNRKIKLKEEGDAYGVKTRSELRTYFSSERYLECFEDEFDDLVKILGKEHLLETSQVQMPAILANQLMIEGIGPKYNTEFIPTLILKEWPRCAFEWRMRERKTRPDSENKIVYRWPKPNYIAEVAKMGCNLVPMGHYNPSQPNKVMKIEWQLQFARAEQLLLRSLGHSQIRLLLLVEFLMRDHLKDIPGLKTQHLRYILFWMCEHNFRDWQEETLGLKLKAYMKTLYNCLSTENLPHYFIDKCNLLETIPQRYLRQIQSLVRNMKDNLPVYLMHTMRRMHTADDFYPLLDIKELYKLVTPERYGMENLNPKLLALIGGEDNKKQIDDGEDVLYSDSDEEKEHQTKAELHRLREERAEKKKQQGDNPKVKRKPSTINLKKKVQTLKDLRAGKLLSYFARHFIQMARSSNEYRSYPQAYMYLLLAGNMATLLDETNNSSEAEEFRREIAELNLASRGGVHDMLGSSWAMTDNYDIIPSNSAFRGSNWELKKEHQPLPTPPNGIKPNSIVKVNINSQLKSVGSTLTHIENNVNAKPNIGDTSDPESLTDDITKLPDTPNKKDASSESDVFSENVLSSEKTNNIKVVSESEKEDINTVENNKEDNRQIIISEDDDEFGDTYL